MHAYLRSIGLTDDRITEKDIEKLCDRVYEKYDHMESVRDEDTKATFLEFSKELGKGFGLKVLGMQDSFGFHRTSYYPYVVSSGEGSDGSVGIQKKLMGDAFIGVCNDGHVGDLYASESGMLSQRSEGRPAARKPCDNLIFSACKVGPDSSADKKPGTPSYGDFLRLGGGSG